MSLVGFKARNHPQQTRLRRGNPVADDRRTPLELWAQWNVKYGPFTMDVAASPQNMLCDLYYTIESDGLHCMWYGRVWCNPPYSEVGKWVTKAWRELERCEVICMLVPANRCEQKWWQTMIEPYRDRGGVLSVQFLPGRLRFGLPITDPRGDRPPFGCALLVWARTERRQGGRDGGD